MGPKEETATSPAMPRTAAWYSTPVTIVVGNPKTPRAYILSITPHPSASQLSPLFPGVTNFLEPAGTKDGKFILARQSRAVLNWVSTKDQNQSVRSGPYDIVYFVNESENGPPCDVTQFKAIYPLANAPYHPVVRSRYGFARYPFRDAEGTIIPYYVELGGTYPWIDQDGKNLIFTTMNRNFFYTETSGGKTELKQRFANDCNPGSRGGACSPSDPSRINYFDMAGGTRGFTLMGLWTRGKMVVMDNLLNHIDYGFPLVDSFHQLLTLYSPSNYTIGSSTGKVWTGSGRDCHFFGIELCNNGNGGDPGPLNPPSAPPFGYFGNTTFSASPLNLFNQLPNMKPNLARDVVWQISNGTATQEVAFDDWLDPNAFILSSMAATVTWQPRCTAGSPANCNPNDGYLRYRDGNENVAVEGVGYPIHLQNAATTATAEVASEMAGIGIKFRNKWQVPSVGVASSDIRVEPVALGGVEGKGLWMNRTSSLTYAIPVQPTGVDSTPWYLGIFIDARTEVNGESRRLFTFPDGSSIRPLSRLGQCRVPKLKQRVGRKREFTDRRSSEPRPLETLGICG